LKDISLVLQVWKFSKTKYSGFGDGEWWIMSLLGDAAEVH
jgi:hypothetical protein